MRHASGTTLTGSTITPSCRQGEHTRRSRAGYAYSDRAPRPCSMTVPHIAIAPTGSTSGEGEVDIYGNRTSAAPYRSAGRSAPLAEKYACQKLWIARIRAAGSSEDVTTPAPTTYTWTPARFGIEPPAWSASS